MRGVAAYSFAPNVPTAAMRQGDFSAFAVIRDPLTNAPFAIPTRARAAA
jgi:hypothetical protein